MKKAQSLSMNTIIIAALALLVLVIVAVVFLGRMGIWGQNVNDCASNGGTCSDGADCLTGMTKHPSWKCYNGKEVDAGKTCCVQTGLTE